MALPVIRLTTGGTAAAKMIAAMPGKFAAALPLAVDAAMHALVGYVQEHAFAGTGPDTLQPRTGILRGSVGHRWMDQASLTSAIGVYKGSATAYAKAHEYGKVIRPKKGRALAIPLKAARTDGGMSRFPQGPTSALAKAAYPDMFVLSRKEQGKPPLLVAAQGKKIVALWALVPVVRIPARRWLSTHARAGSGAFIAEFDEQMARAMSQAS